MASNVVSKAVTTSAVVSATGCTYYGFTFAETAGVVATIRIYDNASAASGTLLETINLAASGSAGEFGGPQGVRANNGIYVAVTGTVVGSVRIG